MPPTIDWYNRNGTEVSKEYESIDPEKLHDWLIDFLPKQKTNARKATVLDVGAGSGRDAAWLAKKGYSVVAIEPSETMREGAKSRHDDAAITWMGDKLPELDQTTRSGLSFDFILLSAVWMHVPQNSRERAFRKLINLLNPGGRIAITLRNGPAEDGRVMEPVSASEFEKLALDHGAIVQHVTENTPDLLGREDVTWSRVVIRLPDDGAGGLPILRNVILNDKKSSTHKLGLLQTLCRIADGAGGLQDNTNDEFVTIPFGLVALTWIQLYQPLLKANLPQSPGHLNRQGLAFAQTSFYDLMKRSSPLDLSVGAQINEETAATLHRALNIAANNIARMPANRITYDNITNRQVFRVAQKPFRDRTPLAQFINSEGFLIINKKYLSDFGKMKIPRNLWNAFQRYSAWIEPTVTAEWIKKVKEYAKTQGRTVSGDTIANALIRKRLGRRSLEEIRKIARDINWKHCVWTGNNLRKTQFDIDHCLPWSVWPCGDLWNLMPAGRSINQSEKRDKLPSDKILRLAQDIICDWWDKAYISGAYKDRFGLEASSSLPGLPVSGNYDAQAVFEALQLQRMRIRQNQQAPEWRGE